MRVLKIKGAKNYRRFSVKVPAALLDKIEALDAEIKNKGFVYDWSESCVEALKDAVAAVEKDLRESESEGGAE